MNTATATATTESTESTESTEPRADAHPVDNTAQPVTADRSVTGQQPIEQDAAAVMVVQLDPAQVAQHPDNIRDASRGIKELTASVAEVGVLVPLIVVPVALVPGHDWPDTVTHVAVDGNRRQAAAAAAGLSLPCIVRADLATAKATARTMAVTGLVRDGLTATEEAHAVAALFDAKMSGAAIGRAIGRSTAQVKTARRAAQVPADIAAQAADYPLTLDQLAVLADHQDNPADVAALLDAAPRGLMDHVVAQLRAQQAEDTAVAAAVGPVCAELASSGVAVLEDEPNTYAPGGARSVEDLTIDDGNGDQVQLTAESHAACPGYAAYVAAEYYPADPDDDQPEEVEVSVLYVCTDPARFGHTSRRWADRNPAPGPGSSPAEPAEGETASDTAARITREQEAAAEAKKAERRELIARNKQADAAAEVRRAFVRQCLAVKSRHKAMTGWALHQVIQRDPTFCRWAGEYYSRPAILAELLGGDPRQVTADTPAARHGVILWAQVATANEEDLPRDAHRQRAPSRARYLRHLQTLGYVLAEVEQMILDNAADDEPPAETASGDPADADQTDDAGHDAEGTAA